MTLFGKLIRKAGTFAEKVIGQAVSGGFVQSPAQAREQQKDQSNTLLYIVLGVVGFFVALAMFVFGRKSR